MVVARSRRPSRVHRAVLSQLALLDELRRTGLAGRGTGVLAQLAGRPRDDAPPVQLTELLDRFAHQRVPAQQHHQRRSRGFYNPQQPDCPRTGSAHGTDTRNDRRGLRRQSEHDQQPARRQSRVRPVGPRRTGRQMALGHLQLLGSHCRSAPLHARRAIVRLGQSPSPGNHRCAWRFVQCSVLQAVLPRWRDEHPRMGTL